MSRDAHARANVFFLDSSYRLANYFPWEKRTSLKLQVLRELTRVSQTYSKNFKPVSLVNISFFFFFCNAYIFETRDVF